MPSRLTCTLLALAPVASTAQAPPAGDREQGARLFATHCAPCHGPHGEGARGPTLAQATLPRASDAEALVKIIQSGIAGTEMPSSRLPPQQVSHIAAFVKSLAELPGEILAGNPARGAQLYQTKGACAQCHTLRGEGGVIGPELTEIGRRRSAAYLRRALVDPSAEVPQSFSAYRRDVDMPENFLFVRIATRDGRAVAGVRVNEDTFSIQLRDLTGRIHSFHKSELAELNKDWGKSPMPAYGAVFTAAEMDDLIAFLVSLRGVSK